MAQHRLFNIDYCNSNYINSICQCIGKFPSYMDITDFKITQHSKQL